jgi:hypothetical protein
MNKMTTILGGACLTLLGASCSSSSSPTMMADAGQHHDSGTGTKEDAKGGGTKEAGGARDTGGTPHKEAGGGDAGSATHVLVTYAGTTPGSTLVAVNLATKAVDGTLNSSDSDVITVSNNASAPFLLEQSEDQVVELEPAAPWKAEGSWSVALTADTGQSDADPVAVLVTSDSQAYVARYDSNQLDIINLSEAVDGGKAMGTFDLSTLVQTGDDDGLVDVQALVYVAATSRVYVVMANNAAYAYVNDTPYTLCGTTKATVTAIDTTGNALVNLDGTGKGGSIELVGADPTSVVYDPVGGRILVFEAGCSPAATTDGGTPGALQQAGVEAVDLSTSTSAMLLQSNSQGYPGNLVLIDSTHAVIGWSYPTIAYVWDPTMTSLGAALPNAPQLFDYDGHGNLVGANINYGDGGAGTTDIVSMSLATGDVTVLQANVLTVGNSYIASVNTWPKP